MRVELHLQGLQPGLNELALKAWSRLFPLAKLLVVADASEERKHQPENGYIRDQISRQILFDPGNIGEVLARMLITNDSGIACFQQDADENTQGQILQDHLSRVGALNPRPQEVPQPQADQTPQQIIDYPGKERHPEGDLPFVRRHLHEFLKAKQNPKRRPARQEDQRVHEKGTAWV